MADPQKLASPINGATMSELVLIPEFSGDDFDIPAPQETASPDPIFADPIRFYGCDSKFGVLKSSVSLQIDILGIEKGLYIIVFKTNDKVTNGFVSSKDVSTDGMKDFIEFRNVSAIRMKRYAGFGRPEFAYWILDHEGRFLPDAVDRKTDTENKYYFGSVDKIVFEKTLTAAATLYPGKYEIVTTPPLNHPSVKSKEPLWFRTLLPLVVNQKQEGGLVELTDLKMGREVDREYHSAVNVYDVDNPKEFFRAVRAIKAKQANRFQYADPVEMGTEEEFAAQLIASEQLCDTDVKAEKWYNRNVRKVRSK